LESSTMTPVFITTAIVCVAMFVYVWQVLW
jgi:hypothetical protein